MFSSAIRLFSREMQRKSRARRRCGNALSTRALRVEGLENRMLLTVAPLADNLDLQEDASDLVGDGTVDALVGDFNSGGAAASCPLIQVDYDGDGLPDADVFVNTDGELPSDLDSQLETVAQVPSDQWDDALNDLVDSDSSEQLINDEAPAPELRKFDDLSTGDEPVRSDEPGKIPSDKVEIIDLWGEGGDQGYYTIKGKVSDGFPADCYVYFTSGLQGNYGVQVGEDGTFEVQAQLEALEYGGEVEVTAVVEYLGMTSDEYTAYI